MQKNGRVNTRRQISCTVFQVTQTIKIPTVNDSAVWKVPLKQQENLQKHDTSIVVEPNQKKQTSIHQHQRKPSTTFQQLLEEKKSRDNSIDLTFTKLNSRQNSMVDQQVAVTVIKKSKQKPPSPTSTVNYTSLRGNMENNFRDLSIDTNEYYSQKVKVTQEVTKLKTHTQNVQINLVTKPLMVQNNLNSLLSERQKQQQTAQANIPKKVNTRCVSMDGQNKPRPIIKTPEQSFMYCDEQILVEEVVEYAGSYQKETLQYLMLRELDWYIDPDYLKRHPALNNNMRTILMDWMMEVCNEFMLKRETYHISICLVDKFLSVTSGKQQKQLQLIAVSAMLVAAKIEEIYPPGPTKFAESADHGYSIDQILQMEIELLIQLKWQTTLPTMNLWINWYCGQWDLFINDPQYSFKLPNREAYQLFRQLCQLIDCATLDIDFLKGRPRQLLAAFMYLVLSIKFKYMTVKIIQDIVPTTSQFLLDSTNNYNALFSQFAQSNFGFNMPDLLPSIWYCAKFFHLQFTYDKNLGQLRDPQSSTFLPEAFHQNQNIQEGHYEEMLSYQTHNSYNIQCIKIKRKL